MANSYREYLKMKKYGGEGGDTPSPTLISKTINANGLYLPEDDQADGYNSVSVNVPEVSDIAFVPPQKFKSNGSNLQDYKIFGKTETVVVEQSGVLPLTFTTTEDKLRDWEIRGNDLPGTENLFDISNVVDRVISGVTYLAVVDGKINVNLTSSNQTPDGASSTLRNLVGELDLNTTYTLQATSTVTDKQIYLNGSGANFVWSFGQSKTFTTQADLDAALNAVVRWYASGSNTSAVISDVMLAKGSTAPVHYIPYQQGVGKRTVNLFDVSQARPVTSYRFMEYTFSCEKNIRYTLSQNKQMMQLDIYSDSTKSELLYRSFNKASYTFDSGEHTSLYFRIDQQTPQDDYRDKQIMLTQGSTAPSTYVPFGYEIPISVNGTPQTFYIGSNPLTAGQSISKTSTGIDISTAVGENTISTTLYNKPETSITYAESGGVGEESSGSYSIPVKINSTTTNVPIGDTPLMEDEYVSYAEQKIYRYVDGTLTPVDPPSALPQIATANGVNELSVETDIQPELVQIGLGIPVELIPTALGTKNITANDTYDASDDSLDGYSSVTVNVPEKVLTTKTITASGTYNAVDDQADGYSSVTVNVSSYNETWVNRIDFVITEVTS